MKFIANIKEKDYQEYCKKSKYSTFLQSYEWGQFCGKNKNLKPYYVGLLDDNNKIVASTLLLKKELPFKKCYFYAPRGFNFDLNNQELLNTFTIEIKKFMKTQKAVYLTVDPEIMYQEVDNNAKLIENGKNNYVIHKSFLDLGYQHNGFNLLYENNKPRYTFIIDLKPSITDIEAKMNKSFLKNVEKSKNLGVEFIVGNESDLKTFNEIYNSTKERDNFIGYNEDYYTNFYNLMKKANMAEIFLCKIYPKVILKNLNNNLKQVKDNLKAINNQNKIDILNNQQNKITKDIEFFNQYKDQQSIVVAAHIMGFYNNTAIALYAGNLKEFASTYANNLLYYEKIKYAKERGCTSLDLFGVVGDPNTNYKNLAGIYEFKKQLGGDLIEFLGEYELITNKVWYKLLNIYRKIKY